MWLKVFLLGLFSAFASDFLTLVTNINLINKNAVITCDGNAETFEPILFSVNDEVPGYRVAPYCDIGKIQFDGRNVRFDGRSAYIHGFLMYVCAADHNQFKLTDGVCGFHYKGTMHSLHVVYKGAKIDDKVVFNTIEVLKFGFSDIYDGNVMSYGNFVAVFSNVGAGDVGWKLAVGSREDSYTVASAIDMPGTNQDVVGDKTLRSYVYPRVPADLKATNDAFILSVGVFGTVKCHQNVQTCMKEKPAGSCIHFDSKTFFKGGSDMLKMALPSNMETYYFEYSVFKFFRADQGGIYDRVIFKTSVVKRRMIDSFQKRVFFSSDEAGEILIAANMMRCPVTFETCMNGKKKSFKLTFLGYTMAQQVQKLIVHGGDIVVNVEDKDCQERNSQCIVTAELFAYRYTQMWIENMRDTHNGVINPYEDYQAMVFQGLTVVIEPVGKGV